MLGDVALVVTEDLVLNGPCVLQQPSLQKRGCCLGHAPHVVVLAKERRYLSRKRVDHGGVVGGDELGHAGVAGCSEEFPEAHGVKVQCVYLAHGISGPAVDRYPQERPCHGDSEPRGLLAEVLQGGQRLRALLYLVEDDEGLLLLNDLSRFELEGRDEPLYVIAELELLLHSRVLVQVNDTPLFSHQMEKTGA